MKQGAVSVNFAGLADRIDALSEQSVPVWGKMTVSEMLVHCEMHIRMTLGEVPCKDRSVFIAKDLAKYFLLHLRFTNFRNMPTVGEINIVKNGYIVKEEWGVLQTKLKKAIKDLVESDERVPYSHPFLGRMSKDHTLRINYIHIDHHLCQFGG